jgi:hypothetical protein
MLRSETSAALDTPFIEHHLSTLTVEELKWYAAVLASRLPTRKAELVTLLTKALTNSTEVQRLWEQLTPVQRQVVAEVVHTLSGRYDAEVIEAKYPGAKTPVNARISSIGYEVFYGSHGRRKPATPYDLLFAYSYEFGPFIPADVASLLRAIAPQPPATQLHSQDEPPTVLAPKKRSAAVAVVVTDTERAVFHDLAATLYLIQQGKVSVSATTRLPSLTSLRQLRQRLLVGDYFAEQEYERAEDAIRPLALIMLVQAAKWAAPVGSGGKLELTKSGQALLTAPLEASHIREAWQRWLKSDLLDELSRIRTIKGQQSKRVRLTKPAERREKLNAALQVCPVGRWVALDELFRYMRAEGQLPAVERNSESGLYIGAYAEYGWLGYGGVKYWDVVIGSYLRAVLWEYAATLGLIEIAYTWPEETPHDFGHVYGLDDYDYLSRYDGLLGLRLTNLGAFVLGLTDAYSPPPVVAEQGPAVLKVLPNLDVVITDARRVMANDRTFLERIGTATSQDVYRLSREQVLEAAEQGLSIEQMRAFLANKSGLSESELPQTVRVFFEDLQQRLGALREGGKMLVLEGDDPYLLTELANTPALRSVVRLATVDRQTVLLVPEDREATVRRQLRKLGYVAKKGSTGQ